MPATWNSLRDLVDVGRGVVSREVFVNDAIYAQELEQIFARAWLFIGHESQVPNPGDYFASRMGEEAVLLTRDRQRKLHVFLNTCRHRGMKVCRYEVGNSLLFTCPFHGWTYDTDGRLVGVPGYSEFYHEELDRSQWGLIEVPQLANYHGSIWATWDPQAPSFEEYIGDYDYYLRPHFQGDDGRDGGAEIFGGVQKWRMPCNWKFPALTFNGDRLHATMTHRSTAVASFGPQGSLADGFRHGVQSRREPLQYEVRMDGLGHGGAATIRDGDEPYVDTWQTVPGADDYYRAMHEARQRDYPDRPRVQAGCNVFPNFITGGAVRTIAVWHPAGPDTTEVWRFFLVDSRAPDAVRDGLRRFQMRYSGPVGMTEQDDMENWNYAHAASRGTIARRYPYNYQMGLGHEDAHDGVPGSLNQITAEHAQRGRFARWLEFMESPSWADMYPLNTARQPSTNGR